MGINNPYLFKGFYLLEEENSVGETEEALDREGWSKHYNIDKLNSVVDIIRSGNVQVWANELLDLYKERAKCLEIGCGTGITSLWLAKNGRRVTAIDYTEQSVELVRKAAEILGVSKLDLIEFYNKMGMPYLQITEEELAAEVEGYKTFKKKVAK